MVALAISMVCLFRAGLGRFGIERSIFLPMLALSLVVFTYAIMIDVRIGRSVQAFSLFEGAIGMFHAWLQAPVLIVAYSLLGLMGTMMFGGEGRLSHFPESAEDAHIAFAVVSGFLSLSIPTIFTRHPAAST